MRKFIFLLLFLPILNIAQASPHKVIFLGDSMTDTGNLYKFLGHLVPKSPPYYKGHFSNGTVWAEKLYQRFFPGAKDFNDRNYAVGGAGAVLSLKAMLPYTLSTEVSNYFLHNFLEDKSDVLFIIWIGGNNYLRAPNNPENITERVVNGIAKQIKRLHDAGGKYFMIMNLPNMKNIPWAIQNKVTARLDKLSSLHNAKLAQKITALKNLYPESTFIDFDVDKIYQYYLTHADEVGIKYLDTPCLKTGLWSKNTPLSEKEQIDWLTHQASQEGMSLSASTVETMLSDPVISETLQNSMLYGAINVEKTENCNDYLFYDRIHPTHKVHDLFAEFAINRLQIAGITFQ